MFNIIFALGIVLLMFGFLLVYILWIDKREYEKPKRKLKNEEFIPPIPVPEKTKREYIEYAKRLREAANAFGVSISDIIYYNSSPIQDNVSDGLEYIGVPPETVEKFITANTVQPYIMEQIAKYGNTYFKQLPVSLQWALSSGFYIKSEEYDRIVDMYYNNTKDMI